MEIKDIMKQYKRDCFGNYISCNDLLNAIKSHSKKCIKAEFVSDDYKDMKLLRLENGFKCKKCGESFRIPIRYLRATIK